MRILRIVIPALVILIWLTAAGIGGPYFGKVSEVSSNDPAAYLPESAEATKVQALLPEFRASDDIPAIVLFTSSERFTHEELSDITGALKEMTEISGVSESVSPALPSDDGYAAQAFVGIANGADVADVVHNLNDELKSLVAPTIEVFITGPAGFSADLQSAFAGIDGLLLIVALIAVFIILLLVYRSLLLPIAVLATSVFALTAALLTVWWLAKMEVLILSGQTQGILFILVIGAATDYSLLYVSRYREMLQSTSDKWQASRAALRASFEPIVASGGTVIAGLMCLLLSDLKSNSGLGPVASIGIVFAMLSALTLLPSILYAFGRFAFWPRIPKLQPQGTSTESDVAAGSRGIWAALARAVQKRPRTIWLATTAALVFAALGVTQLNATGVAQSDLVLTESQARDGQIALAKHFPGGSGSPLLVIVNSDSETDATDVLLAHTSVTDVQAVEAQTGSTSNVLLQATLNVAADSNEALDAVHELRGEFSTAEIDALIGGVSAIALDTNEASIQDRNLIIPVVLIVIFLILTLLLRAVLAPLLLIITTVLSYGSAMGVAALVFNGVFNFPGADPAVPLFGFIFLVALGVDYNIFLMTRVREESLKGGTRTGVLRGLTVTGGVITSAGLVLAATFAALSVIPILFLLQLSFIVAFGVLLDTFIVRTLLVPALAYDIGDKVWWPSKLGRGMARSTIKS